MKINNKKFFDIINIVTLYNNEEEVFSYAKKLSNQKCKEKIALVIVINNLENKKIKKLEKNVLSIDLAIFIYNPNKNLGYLNGLIYGYERFIQENEEPNWIIMSNTDITFRNNNFICDFFEVDYNDEIWCIGPSIYSLKTKSYENPQYVKRHTLKTINRNIKIFKKKNFISDFYIRLSYFKSKLTKKIKLKSQYVYSNHGAFFIIRNSLANYLIENKYGVLMYSEEAYIAEIIRLNNKRSYYNSEIEVVHEGSSVTGKINSRKRYNLMVQSLEYIRDKFYK